MGAIQERILASADNPLFSYHNGKFVELDGGPLSGNTIDQIGERLKVLSDTRDRQALKLLAHQLLGPIFDVARYEAWTNGFFMEKSGSPTEIFRIPLWSYAAFAYNGAPIGQPVYNTQIGRKYATISWNSTSTAVAIDWDDMAYTGWPVLDRMITESAWELARQIDLLAKAVLDTAATTVTNHNPSVAGAMTKASVDSIIKNSVRQGFPVRYAAINRGTVMDISNWVIPQYSMFTFGPTSKFDEVWNNLWVDGYGGITWLLSKDVPVGSVYFAGLPENGGWRFMTPTRQAFDQDIDRALDKYRWDIKNAWTYVNNYNIYRLDIT